MIPIKPITWAGFCFMALALVAGGYAQVGDFHSLKMLLTASVPVFTGLAGLCLHPPWAPAAVAPPEKP